MELFGVGAGEALLVLVITMIVVGPQRFPTIAREGGRWFRMARRFTAEITSDVREAMTELEEEVAGGGDELRSIREIGTEVETGLKESAADIRQIGRETDAEATASVDLEAAAPAPEAPSPGAPEQRRDEPVPPAVEPTPSATLTELQRRRSPAELQQQLADAYRDVRGGGASPTPSPADPPAAATDAESE